MAYTSLTSFTSIPVKEEKSLNKILIENVGLTKDKVEKLINLMYGDIPMLSIDENSNFTYEVIGLLSEYGYEKTYKFLKEVSENPEGKYPSPKLIFKTDLFKDERETYNSEISKIRDLNELKKGAGMYTCKKCGSKDTVSVTGQTRAADEAETTYVTCNSCGFYFTL